MSDIMRPRYITFDCYGTLTHFQMTDLAKERFADRIPDAERMARFCTDFAAYRFDEVLGAYQPYDQVVRNALERTCHRWGLAYDDAEGMAFYDAVPTWGPHPDVTEGLARIADKIPLVIYSNASEDQIMANVEKLGVPFAHVFTAERFKVYKPRLAAFEAMIDTLGCAPEELLHVSSSFRYDLFSAAFMGIRDKAFINRGHEPYTPGYGATEVADTHGLATLVGL
ncbi:haloacid dehalogenase type II [Salinisphaera sp. Q1T1-3]|uniref:haloacid dehalogenase type II n=1 Tax=Salinisphaera sp. Q1T1-3 TaxID=2321229 RepID=UPI000E73838A|nr:haloacid dehalogenase type II [Salinisphaera sp. Q1T1-3]RJS91839.1 haloacid dehalogenase type II [Salinisphaera sp. Q1T1-3]